MKKFIYLFISISLMAAGCSSSAQVYDNGQYGNQNYSNAEINYQTFYDQLQPYGNWIDYPEYGYVWQPNAGTGFRPYETNGHWVSTVDGWAWASDYNWGWAPFHYGRWMLDEAVGWMWVPGYEWAPAWVTWGQYDNYYAWAPLAPGINISIGNTWRPAYNYWNFVPNNYIQSQNLGRYVGRNNFNGNVVNNITIINNYNSYDNKDYYHRGPDYREVERYTHRNITPLAIAPASRPGMNSVTTRQFQVYRPAIARNDAATRNPAPAVIRNMNEVRSNDLRRNNSINNNNRINNTNPVRPYNNNGIRNTPSDETRNADINRPYNNGNTINQNNTNNQNNNNTINQNRRFSQDNDLYNQRRNQQPPVAPNINQPANPVNSDTRPNGQPGNSQNFPQRQINRNPAVNNPQPNQQNEQNNRNIQRVENWRQQNTQPVRQAQPQNPAVMPNRQAMPAQQRPMPAATPQRNMPVQRPERTPAAQPAQNGQARP